MSQEIGSDGVNLMITRVETAVRMEGRLTEVLKGLAESLGISVGDLLESSTPSAASRPSVRTRWRRSTSSGPFTASIWITPMVTG